MTQGFLFLLWRLTEIAILRQQTFSFTITRSFFAVGVVVVYVHSV